MTSYQTSIEIAAPPRVVWQALTQQLQDDPTAFGILKLAGTLARGAKLKLWSEVAPDRAFALTVTTFDAPHKMVWRGGMPLGLFTGTRTFTLTSDGAGTHFHMEEVFTGLMSGMITKSMPDLTPSFTKFANTLKAKAEAHE
ncbi:MAG: SRPBCC domain-containing protein [Pseudomonadota bacterium]